MRCNYSPYTLPPIDFIGGETQNFIFNVYHYAEKRPFSLEGCTCDFSIVDFTSKSGRPILSKTIDGASGNAIEVTLSASDTVNLFGKYIYQISIMDAEGRSEIPKQGVLYITNNINESFIGE